MVACTFDSTTVPSRQIISERMVGPSGTYEYEVKILCRTKTYSQYTALAAKFGRTGKTTLLSGKTSVQSVGGTCGSLVLNGTTYTNCYIADLSNAEIPQTNFGAWEFTITFVRHTV
jgi:hypothetical protein